MKASGQITFTVPFRRSIKARIFALYGIRLAPAFVLRRRNRSTRLGTAIGR
jgi:hypothetical protein